MGEKMETVTNFVFLGSKITADGDCIHEIRRHLRLGRKAMTNLDRILKSRDTTLLTKLCILKEIVFPVQFSHWVMSDSLWPHEPQHARPLYITNSQSPPKPMSIESVMPSNHLILCIPLLLPSIFASIRVFSNESALRMRWPKYWSFSFNISPFQWTPRTDLL